MTGGIARDEEIPSKASAEPVLPSIFKGLLEDRSSQLNSGVVAALWRLYNVDDNRNIAEELKVKYPEAYTGVQFLKPEALGETEAHMRAKKLNFALKADASLFGIAESHALLGRILAQALSYAAESPDTLDAKVLAKTLSDAAKALIDGAKLTETSRVELVCNAFGVPRSAARKDVGVSLLGSSFAKKRGEAARR